MAPILRWVALLRFSALTRLAAVSRVAWLGLIAFLWACSDSDSGAGLEMPTPESVQPYGNFFSAQYDDLSNWLCHPDLAASDDVCDSNLDALVVNVDGSSSVEVHQAAASPAVDCFYVYPTVSADPGGNADLIPNAEEIIVTRNQAARYSEVCSLYAPSYRQATVAVIFGGAESDRELAYGDVESAFRHYIANHNNGRGFILIGHSQGSGHLARVIRDEIEGNEFLSDRLIAAHLIGSGIRTPEGADIGGTFNQTPVCRNETQTGCVIGFSAYREDDPFLLAGEARFGRTSEDGEPAVCANPAALGGGLVELDTYLTTETTPLLDALLIRRVEGAYKEPDLFPPIEQLFFKLPGLISGECRTSDDGVNFLAIVLNPTPESPRADDINGEVLGIEDWGLHLLDISLPMGDLVDLAASQSSAWLAGNQ